MRKVRTDHATAYGLHRRFPDCLLTCWPPHLFVTSCRPPAGASCTARGVPNVIPPEIAHGERPPRRPTSPGMAVFVSGMYRDNDSAPAAIVERCEAISGLDGRIRAASPHRTGAWTNVSNLRSGWPRKAGGTGNRAHKRWGATRAAPFRAVTNENRFARRRPSVPDTAASDARSTRISTGDPNDFDSFVKIPTGSQAAQTSKCAVKKKIRMPP